MKNFYEILGVMPDVPQEIIVAVYRTWMHALKYHPDLGGDEEIAKKINSAYDVLKDPDKRKKYDSALGNIENIRDRNRRAAPRYKVEARIGCLAPDEKWHATTAKDVSAFGMRVRANFRADIGDVVSVSFPVTASHSIEVKICWKKPLGNSEYEYGMKFFKPLPDILKRMGYKAK